MSAGPERVTRLEAAERIRMERFPELKSFFDALASHSSIDREWLRQYHSVVVSIIEGRYQ